MDAFHMERAQRAVTGSYARQNCDPDTLDLIQALEHENATVYEEIHGVRLTGRAFTGRTVFRHGILAYLAIAMLVGSGCWLHYSARGQRVWLGTRTAVWAVGVIAGVTRADPPKLTAHGASTQTASAGQP